MADQSDVEIALAALVASILYPQGATAPSILGRVCRIYRGWPNAPSLDADLAAGVVNVTVFPAGHQQRNTTRWRDEFLITSRVMPTLTVTVADTTATFGGTVAAGQLAGLLADNMAVVHRTEVGDTLEIVAAILAAQIRAERIAILSNASVTVPGARRLIGRVVADQTAQHTVRRQHQSFRITFWCPDHASRDMAAGATDAAMADLGFISLQDGTAGRLRFVSGSVSDENQDATLYRRDLVYGVEYATTLPITLPEMIFGDSMTSPNGSVVGRSLLS